MFERPRGCSILFDQSRVLLRYLVHLGERLVDLVDSRGLLRARPGNLGDHRRHSFDGLQYFRQCCARLVHEINAFLDLAVAARDLMSLAACEERCASVRTSDATTANPRPASPAHAASTAALSARRL